MKLVQLIRMEKSIRQMWINVTKSLTCQNAKLTALPLYDKGGKHASQEKANTGKQKKKMPLIIQNNGFRINQKYIRSIAHYKKQNKT